MSSNSAPRRKPAIEGFALYKHFDADGNLLYVGVTRRPVEREIRHRTWSSWHALSVRREEERLPTLEEALHAEQRAIQTEGPIFNYQHAESGFYRRVADYINIELPPEPWEYISLIDGLLKSSTPLVRHRRRVLLKKPRRATQHCGDEPRI